MANKNRKSILCGVCLSNTTWRKETYCSPNLIISAGLERMASLWRGLCCCPLCTMVLGSAGSLTPASHSHSRGGWVCVCVCLCVCKDPQAKFSPPHVEGMYFIIALDWFQMSRDNYRGKTVCKGGDARNGLSAWVALLQACWAQFPSEIRGEEIWAGESLSAKLYPGLCSGLQQFTQ